MTKTQRHQSRPPTFHAVVGGDHRGPPHHHDQRVGGRHTARRHTVRRLHEAARCESSARSRCAGSWRPSRAARRAPCAATPPTPAPAARPGGRPRRWRSRAAAGPDRGIAEPAELPIERGLAGPGILAETLMTVLAGPSAPPPLLPLGSFREMQAISVCESHQPDLQRGWKAWNISDALARSRRWECLRRRPQLHSRTLRVDGVGPPILQTGRGRQPECMLPVPLPKIDETLPKVPRRHRR